ncbi:hypothetical protein KAH37_09320, partial [bacterium]|nr:hypothetical protein [bacterium]
ALYIVDVDWGARTISCLHAFAIGTMNITDADGTLGSRGSFSFNGNLDIYSSKHAMPYDDGSNGGDVSAEMPWPACSPY